MPVVNKTNPTEVSVSSLTLSPPFLPALLVLFAGSGVSALIYEIVWYQLLQLVIGSTAVSLGVLLAAFMGGLCLGSFALPRFVSERAHPLKVYAWIELGIGICGLAAHFGMPLIDRIYTGAVGHGFPAVVLRAVVCAVCLLPPTMLMGASLPAAARWLKSSPEGVSWMGLLYGANTGGAVAGCVLAGFYLLRVFDMAKATYIAAAINLAVALVALALARRASYQPWKRKRGRSPLDPRRFLAGLREHRIVGRDGARRRSGLDTTAGSAARRDRLHVLDHPGRVPGGLRDRQRGRVRFSQNNWLGRAWRWVFARCCWWALSRGPLTCWPVRCPIGR